MNTFGNYLCVIFGVLAILISLHQLKIWLGLIKRGVILKAVIVDTFKDNDLDECPIVKFSYKNEEEVMKLYEPNVNIKFNESIDCIYDPLSKKLEINSRWNMPVKFFGPFLLGVIFVWTGLSLIKNGQS
jgi:hypothetical protein